MNARYNSSDNTLTEISQMEKPVRPNQRDYDQVSLGGLIYDADLKKYFLDSDKYNDHIASLRTIPCHPSCKTVLKEGDVLTEGKDYEVREEAYCLCHHCHDQGFKGGIEYACRYCNPDGSWRNVTGGYKGRKITAFPQERG